MEGIFNFMTRPIFVNIKRNYCPLTTYLHLNVNKKVDRSTGFEKKLFESKNSRKALAQEAHMWSTEEM